MTIHGWKQLAEWSIEHSCLTPKEIEEAKHIHGKEWQVFCEWVVSEFSGYAESLNALS